MSRAIWINGEASGDISALERGLHYGEGVFETIACLQGRPRFLALHLERVSLGCGRLHLPGPGTERLRGHIEKVAGEAQRCLVKLLLVRGPALERGYAWGAERGTWIVIRYPWSAVAPEPARVRMAATRLGENPALAGLKHCNRLEQVLARNEDGCAAADEALMLSHSGKLISGTMTNVFLVDGPARSPRLRTPRLDLCGVAGIMRRVVMREAARAHLQVSECELMPEDLQAAREVFLTNARVGIWPVRSLEGRAFDAAPVTQRLGALLRPLLEAPADA